MNLRPYQVDCINSIFDSLRKGNDRIYAKLACGAGKTVIFVKLVEILSEKYENFRCVFVVPKNILIEQTVNKFKFKVGIYNAELGIKELHHPITIASIQSLSRSKHLERVNLVCFDECHRASRAHKKLLERYLEINHKTKLLGLTATDYALDGNLFPDKVFDESIKDLTEKGFLCPVVCKDGSHRPDLDGVKLSGGDYVLIDLEKRFTPKLIDDQVSDMIARSANRNKVIILTTSIKHAEIVHSKIDGSSIIHSKMRKDDRVTNLNSFINSGKYLVSVLIASEGFDFPEADCLVLMRPTRSPTLYEQAVGRIARLSPGKENGLLLDYGGVVESLGTVYNITPPKRGEIKTKLCSVCEAHNEQNSRACVDCGEEFLTICQECLSPKKYGEKCCEKKVVRDMFKELTKTAYSPIEKKHWVNVTGVSLCKHKAKSGKNCVKLTYRCEGFPSSYSEYFTFDQSYAKRMALKNLGEFKIYSENVDEILQETPLVPKRIFVDCSGKYPRILKREF